MVAGLARASRTGTFTTGDYGNLSHRLQMSQSTREDAHIVTVFVV